MRNLIDARFKELVKDTKKQSSKTADTQIECRSTRFDRFRSSKDRNSRESNDDDMIRHRVNNDPVLTTSPTNDVIQVHDKDNQSLTMLLHNYSCAVDWKNFFLGRWFHDVSSKVQYALLSHVYPDIRWTSPLG